MSEIFESFSNWIKMDDLNFFRTLFIWIKRVLHVFAGLFALFLLIGVFADGLSITPLILFGIVYSLILLGVEIQQRLVIRYIVMGENVNEIIVLLEKKFGEEVKA